MKDIATENLFFISFKDKNNNSSEVVNYEDGHLNTKRKPENSLTIDSFIKNVKNRNIDLQNIKNISFLESLPKPNGLNYSEDFKKELKTIKKKQVLKDIYNKNVDNDEGEKQQSIQDIHKEIKEQLTTIFNIFLTVVSCIVACWYWTPFMNISYRLILCIFVGLLVLIADVVVYNSFQRNIRNSKSKKE